MQVAKLFERPRVGHPCRGYGNGGFAGYIEI
jgi:hypothetical protein